MQYSKPKGTKDIIFDDCKKMKKVEECIKELCDKFNIDEIRTPVFENTELFTRSVGDETDIVTKEMYTFFDKGNRSITLRPEGTAGVVRSYIENGMSSLPSPIKLFYNINVYRYEKMQKGRYREFNQFGVEYFGASSYFSDFELILFAYKVFEKLGLNDSVILNINSIGCKKCREDYINALKAYLKDYIDKMCEDCKTRYNKNPLRIIDCKEEKCNEILKNVPKITEYLCEDCNTHFVGLKSLLDKNNIRYVINDRIVRGLDYYNKSVFEFISNTTELTLCGGGRYDSLVSICGGNDTPAIGLAFGIDRLVLELEENNSKFLNIDKKLDIYIAPIGENAKIYATKFASILRDNLVNTELDIMDRNIKAQIKHADKLNAKYLLVIGEDEIVNKKAKIKNMKDSTEQDINLSVEDIIKIIK